MPRIEPGLIPVVTDLERGLRELGIPFGVIGALVPELLLDARPPRMTRDVDVTVAVESLAEFEALKDRLGDYGFARTRLPHRMQHRAGGLLDILPFSEAIAPEGRLQLQDGVVVNMAGFGYVVPNVISIPIDNGPALPLTPLPLYALLKLVAFSDRKDPKDLAGVLHCLEHYREDDERRYSVEHEGAGVPFEDTCAHLLGVDGRRFLDESLSRAARPVLDRFNDPDADVVGLVAREEGRLAMDAEYRDTIVDLFRWYRLGTEL